MNNTISTENFRHNMGYCYITSENMPWVVIAKMWVAVAKVWVAGAKAWVAVASPLPKPIITDRRRLFSY
jgi:hypothetical protein